MTESWETNTPGCIFSLCHPLPGTGYLFLLYNGILRIPVSQRCSEELLRHVDDAQ